MSILIKGLEMPISIERPLEIKIYPNGDVYCRNRGYGGWCAVPVPPHGRLIDAFDTVKTLCDKGLYMHAEIVSDMPTIIQGEEIKK